MNLLSVENISKAYGEKVLFNIESFGIEEGEKIGLIGVNGTGKSTLLRVLAGFDTPDTGKITTSNNLRIEYLPQEPYFDSEATVLEQVFKGNSPVMVTLREYEAVSEQLVSDPDNIILQERLIKLSSKMDAQNAWQLESEAKAILTRLGISDFNFKVGNLSGGQKKRIALASTLIAPADLLILDEPTNHMDNDTIAWLEDYLNKRKGALLMITHDRYFLDRVTNRIIELSGGNIYSYEGNYSIFLEKKLQREELEESIQRKKENLIRRELEWIKRGAKARTTKQKARKDRFEKLVEERVEAAADKVEISSASTRLGKKVIELNNIAKGFDGRKIINDFSLIVQRDDRIGIIGPNGVGKSTLLNIITGKIALDSGSIEIGETVKIGCFSQENGHMDGDTRVIDYIKEAAEFVTTSEGEMISASKMLERFLFTGAMQYTPISKLSGGEKRRLYLLRVLMSAPNVLLLDEPTNDLDIETLTILEDYIDSFDGVVIAVSHDRYFLDRISSEILSFEENGIIIKYTGNYSDYQEYARKRAVEKVDEPEIKTDKKNISDNKKEKKLKFSYNEQREYEQIDSLIENKENELKELEKEIEASSSSYTLLQELLEKKEKFEEELEKLLERWEYLTELAEEIEKSKNS